MINPLIKNCRTGYHDDILHRTSHYKKLLWTKPKIDNRLDRIYLSAQNKQMNRELYSSYDEDNLRMFKKLFIIPKKTTRCKTDAIDLEQSHKRTLKNQYKQRQKSLMISQQNVRLLKKIENVQSEFSSKRLDPTNQSHPKKLHQTGQQLKKIRILDDYYYNNFKLELFRGRIQSRLDKITEKRVKDKQSKRNRIRFTTLNTRQQHNLTRQQKLKE